MATEILMDGELTAILRKKLENEGIEIHTGASVTSIEKVNGGAKVNVTVNGENKTFKAEKVLVCVGRKARPEALNLDAAGLKSLEANDLMGQFTACLLLSLSYT